MYFAGDYVYGGKLHKPLKITDVKVCDDFTLDLEFSTGERRIFNAHLLDGKVFAPLKNIDTLKTAYLEHGVVTWLGGSIDCAPEYMYEHSR